MKIEESSVAVKDHPFLLATEVTSSIALGMLCITALDDKQHADHEDSCLSWRYPAVLVKIRRFGLGETAMAR